MSSTDNSRHTPGSCLCGKVSYELIGEPLWSGRCHCDNCKKTSGSAFQWVVDFDLKNVNILTNATLQTYRDTVTQRGVTLLRQFCGNCGCPVFGQMQDQEDKLLIVAGTLMVQDGKPGSDRGQAKGVMSEWRPQREFFCLTQVEWVDGLLGTEKAAGMPGPPPA